VRASAKSGRQACTTTQARARVPPHRGWPDAELKTTTSTSRYGTVTATAWDWLHSRLTHRGEWADHPGELPIIEGTLIRLVVDHLPGNRDPKPVWLWSSAICASAADVDPAWQTFLRRFDIEHTFLLCGSLSYCTTLHEAPSQRVLQHVSWGVADFAGRAFLLVIAALELSHLETATVRNTCCTTKSCESRPDQVRCSRLFNTQICPQ
jgi:hypothetical protein